MLSVKQAKAALAAYQSYSLTNLPSTIGFDLNVFPAGNGQLQYTWTGAYHGQQNQYNSVVAPFLNSMKAIQPQFAGNPTILKSGWIPSLTMQANKQPLSTKGQKLYNEHDNFCASKVVQANVAVADFLSDVKSLLTPENAPMSIASMNALVDYLVNTRSDTVSDSALLWSIADIRPQNLFLQFEL